VSWIPTQTQRWFGQVEAGTCDVMCHCSGSELNDNHSVTSMTHQSHSPLTHWMSGLLVSLSYCYLLGLGGGMQMRLGSWSEETDRQQSLSSQLVTLTVTFQWIDKVVCLYCTFSIQSHGASKLAGQFWVELVSRSLALLPGTDNDTQVWTDKMSGCYSDTTRERRCQALAIS